MSSCIDAGFVLLLSSPLLDSLENSGVCYAMVLVSSDKSTSATLTGRLDHINYSLQSLTYTSSSGLLGIATLTITINDQGNSGSDGAKGDTKTVSIAVNAP